MGEREVEVPSHFQCPISMDLMRDPVTVVSGITYERDSIETWLFSTKNNNACPVTKKDLSGTSLTPNHTLRRLIQAWCTLHALDRIPTPTPPLHPSHILKLLHDATASQSPSQLSRCIQTLKTIALESQRNRRCMEEAGVHEFLASAIKGSKFSDSDILSAGDVALSVLHLMETSEAGLKKLVNDNGELIMSLLQALRNGKCQSRAYAIQIVKSLFEVADPIQLINAGSDLFRQAVRVLTDRISLQSTKAALKLLMELCPWGRNRVQAVEAGAVHALVEELLLGGGGAERRRSELALAALDQLCSSAEGRAELVKHGAGVAVVAKKILRVSHAASDRAVRILWSLCRYSGTGRVVKDMAEVGAVAKMCLVVQLETDGVKSKERCKEMLRLHSRAWRTSPCVSSYPATL